LGGDDFPPGTVEFQQLAIGKVRDFSKWLKECREVHPERVKGMKSPVSDSPLTGSAELTFGFEDSRSGT
jgi:hypothetical protein